MWSLEGVAQCEAAGLSCLFFFFFFFNNVIIFTFKTPFKLSSLFCLVRFSWRSQVNPYQSTTSPHCPAAGLHSCILCHNKVDQINSPGRFKNNRPYTFSLWQYTCSRPSHSYEVILFIRMSWITGWILWHFAQEKICHKPNAVFYMVVMPGSVFR